MSCVNDFLPALVGLSGLLGQALGLVNGIGLEASSYHGIGKALVVIKFAWYCLLTVFSLAFFGGNGATTAQANPIGPHVPGHTGSFAHELEPYAPFGVIPDRGPVNGEIGRAVITAVLSELMRR